ncbi:MAG: ChaN family lipoprotein [Planctomycetes bacterium]|nr:ChaN family lipoprotein [Planctomycetota bacterium]
MTAPDMKDRIGLALPRFIASLTVLALASIGCRSMPAQEVAPPNTETLLGLELFDGVTGKAATWEQLEARVDAADVVVIGELHGHPLGLPYAAMLYQGSLDRNANTALALEFISRDRQYALDAFGAGLIDMEALQNTMGGSRGSTALAHSPMIEASRAAGRPVYAANAPRIYTTTARKKGYEALAGLSAEQQRLFNVPDPMPGAEYRARFFEFMTGGHDEEEVEGEEPKEKAEPKPPTKGMLAVFRSQALWDGTMSSSTSNAVNDGNSPVFLVIGQFHCDTNGGTVELLRQKQPNAKILVVSVTDEWSDKLREEDQDRADFIVYVGPFPEEE